MDDDERKRRMARLKYLGVPLAFQAAIAERSRPRGYVFMYAAIILAAIGMAVLALFAWSKYLSGAAETAARTANARLFDFDFGLESLGGLFTVLFMAGWLCSWLTLHAGRETARNGTAYDLMHEPAKHKVIIDRIWRWIVARHRSAAQDADDLLDRVGDGLVRDLRRAALGSLIATAILASMLPPHYSWATDTLLGDYQLRFWQRQSQHSLMSATTVTSGCPVLPHDGSTLIYEIHFSDGTDADLGSWRTLRGDHLAALTEIASHLPSGVVKQRFSNPIGSDPLDPECLRHFGGEPGSSDFVQLYKVLGVSDIEKKTLAGKP